MPAFGSQSRLWPVVTFVVTLFALCLLIALIAISVKKNPESIRTCGQSTGKDEGVVIEDVEPNKPGLFHDITTKELKSLRSYLESDPTINAIKLPDDGPLGPEALVRCYVSAVDLYLPVKAEAIAHLEEGHPPPPREALVVLFRGDKSPAVVEERVCGPLPDVASCRLVESSKRRNPVEFALRPFNMMEFGALIEVLLRGEVERRLGFLLRDSFGMSYANCEENPCLDFFTSPVSSGLLGDTQQRRLWVWAHYPVEFYILHPVDFALLAVMDKADPRTYSVDKVWYAGKLYNTVDELVSGYNSSSIPKVKLQMPKNGPDLFSSIHRRGEEEPLQSKRPPKLVEPDGKRYSLSNRQVNYLGWQFNFRMSSLSGPQLFDVRFKGDRIAYEISLQELVVVYSAHNAMHQVTDVADSAGYIGTMAKSLVPGADCPESSTFISNTLAGQLVKGPVHFPNVWCLFEHTSSLPLRRHLGYRFVHGSFYGGMMDSHLTLRTILTIGNYDYVLDFSFHQNGLMDVQVASTGYLMVSPYNAEDSPYGFRIQDHIIGNLHHHLFHFKVDMDVGSSTNNRYSTLEIHKDKTLLSTDRSITYYQTKINQSLKSKERDALYKFNFEKPAYHIVHNENNKTRFGEIKGYRLQLGGMSKQLLPENKNNERTFPWSRYQLVVTKYKEDERTSSSPYAMFDSKDPVVDFSRFTDDNDDIVDTDLVFWLSMGLHHIPRSEDLPLTSTTGTKISFSLMPFNYFPECPSMSSADAIRLDLHNDKKPNEGVRIQRYNGNEKDTCVIPAAGAYDKEIEDNPDSALESSKFLGLL